jgi:hypothetical protein
VTKRLLLPLLCLAAGALALAPAASARVVELGSGAPSATPSCPGDPCEVLARVSGYPGRAGSIKNPFLIRRNGYLLAFTVTLSKPMQAQIDYFTADPPDGAGFGEPQVRISVLRKGTTRKTRLDHRLISQSPAYEIEDYLGSSPTFVLSDPMRVKKGNIVALTSPTWVPAFGTGLGRGNWWRSSRAKKRCEAPDSLRQFAMTTLRRVNVFGCTYHGARPLYTVTYVPDNRPTAEQGE